MELPTGEEEGAKCYTVKFAAKVKDETSETDGKIIEGIVSSDISVICLNRSPINLPSSGGSGAMRLYQIAMVIIMAGLVCTVLCRPDGRGSRV